MKYKLFLDIQGYHVSIDIVAEADVQDFKESHIPCIEWKRLFDTEQEAWDMAEEFIGDEAPWMPEDKPIFTSIDFYRGPWMTKDEENYKDGLLQ